MLEHPITEFIPRKWIIGFFVSIAVAVAWGLVFLYGEAGAGRSLGIAAVYVISLSLGVFCYGFMTAFLPSYVRRTLIAALILTLSLGITWGLATLSGWYDGKGFLKLIPILAIYGSMGWKILALLFRREVRDGSGPSDGETEETFIISEKREMIDRISVKKGSEIYIVKVDELLYVQADGDYVTLFTPAGKFLKEQTMKYFEERLPDNFVRIHRSCIVNIDEITRVELFGKESYHVRLRNGTVLKASVNGYRMLKIRLDL